MLNFTIDQVIRGCEKLCSNARSLIDESVILCASGSFARAYALAHLANEEAAKILMLFWCGLLVIMNKPVAWSKIERRMRDHKQKTLNEVAALKACAKIYRRASLEEVLAGLQKDVVSASDAVELRNDRKNDSL